MARLEAHAVVEVAIAGAMAAARFKRAWPTSSRRWRHSHPLCRGQLVQVAEIVCVEETSEAGGRAATAIHVLLEFDP